MQLCFGNVLCVVTKYYQQRALTSHNDMRISYVFMEYYYMFNLQIY